MPCDIGYRSVADVEITEVEKRTGAPEIDRELLERLGVDDPVFLAWAQGLDLDPLLERALERTREAIDPGEVELRVDNGSLVSRARLVQAGNERLVARLTQRWQLEVLRIVCELLDYECVIGASGLEAEKHGATGGHQYIAIAFTAGGVELR